MQPLYTAFELLSRLLFTKKYMKIHHILGFFCGKDQKSKFIHNETTKKEKRKCEFPLKSVSAAIIGKTSLLFRNPRLSDLETALTLADER